MPKLKKNFKQINKKDEWMLAEHFPDVNFFFSQIWLSSFVNNLKNSCGKNYKKVLAVFEPKNYIHFYYEEKDSEDFEKYLVNKIKKNLNFGHKINKNIIQWSDELSKFTKKLEKINLKKINKQNLADLIKEQNEIHTNLYEWGWLSNATDMFHSTFTNDLNNYLSNKTKDVNSVFNILTSPNKKSEAALEEESLLKIAHLVRNKENQNKINKLIDKHYKKYFYLKYLWIGKKGVYSKKYYENQIKKTAKEKISPKTKIKNINIEIKENQKKKQEMFKDLKISKKYQDLFQIYSDFMLTKVYRRYAQIYWSYHINRLLKEIGLRLKISLDEARYMTCKEIVYALKVGNIDTGNIKKRLKFCFYYAEEKKDMIFLDREHKLLKQLKVKKINGIKELNGQPACLGKIIGKAKIINTINDIKKINKGDVLISIATNPDLLPAMKKAAAFVTEQGGVTSHAAIVARELKTPCIIGTKIATKVIKDGDLVEVDADRGIVKILK